MHYIGAEQISFLQKPIRACFRHRRKQHFVLAPAFNRLIIFGISTPGKVYKPKSSCADHGWPAARKWEQLSCLSWTEGCWLVLDGACLDQSVQEDAESASVHLS